MFGSVLIFLLVGLTVTFIILRIKHKKNPEGLIEAIILIAFLIFISIPCSLVITRAKVQNLKSEYTSLIDSKSTYEEVKYQVRHYNETLTRLQARRKVDKFWFHKSIDDLEFIYKDLWHIKFIEY
jgi:hypothetical protein